MLEALFLLSQVINGTCYFRSLSWEHDPLMEEYNKDLSNY